MAADLFRVRLREMLGVETKLAGEVLPRLIEEVHSPDLRYALERHLAETEAHADAVHDIVGGRPGPERSPALDAIVAEHDRLLASVEDRAAADLVHAMAVAATEHFEMAAYGLLATMADALGEESASIRLREILEQEELALELVNRAVVKLLAEQVESAPR